MYNEGGKTVSKNEYVYTEGMIEGEPTKTYAYTYTNAWKDQLTDFDGQSIVYDACGNPTSYLGATQTVVGVAGNYTDSRYSGRISSGIGDKIMYTMFGDDATGFYDFLE